MLTMLLGKAGSGKTRAVCEEIRARMAERKNMVLLTPEQQSHRAERRLAAVCGPALSLHAEVLSFTRMYSRAAVELGGLADPVPDGGGRLLLMSLALDAVGSRLRRYGAKGRRVDFLRQLLAAAEECRGALITPAALAEAAARASGAVRDKLSDLSLLLEAYEAVTRQQLGDSRDAASRLADGVAECSVGLGGVWADGFTDFTAAELRVLDGILRRGTDLTVTLTLGEGEEPHFRVTEGCFRSLMELAARRGAETRVVRLPEAPAGALRHLAENLYSYPAPPLAEPSQAAELCRMDTFAGECRWAAARIRELLREDPSLRFGDVAAAITDFAARRGTAEAVFREYGLPFFVEETEELASAPAAVYALEALAAVLEGWRAKHVFRMLKTGFGGLADGETDELENYCLTWDIRGESSWRREEDWDLSPGGYDGKKDTDAEALRRLNALRRRVAAPLGRLADAVRQPAEAHALLAALAAFLEETGVRDELRRRAEAAPPESGEAAACVRTWGALSDCLSQMDAVLGGVTLEGADFARLLELLLRGSAMGAIPAALDCVSLGSPARLRGAGMRVLFVLGADDEHLPAAPGRDGLFSPEERRVLYDLGIRLSGGRDDDLTRPLLELYSLAAAPTDRLLVSWSGGENSRPGVLAERAKALLHVPVCTEAELQGRQLAAAAEPALRLAFGEGPWAAAARARLRGEALEALRARAAQPNLPLRPETARRLYGDTFRLTPSRAETFHRCSYLYFMQYGLKAKERRFAGFAAPESGTFQHFLLENVCREVRDGEGFAAVTEERLRALTREYAEIFAAETFRFRQLEDRRFLYLFRRLCASAETVVLDVARELGAGDFVPLDFELSFSDREGGDLPAVRVGDVLVQGTVDRVDGWDDGEKLYLCVTDYKTGKKEFRLSDVVCGVGIQMLMYLFMLSETGGARYGRELVPAGVLYAPARDVLLSESRSIPPEAVEKERADRLRRKGVLLEDPRVLHARENSEAPRYLPVKYRGGVPVSGVVSAEQLGELTAHVKRLLLRMGGDLSAGRAEASPLFESKSEGPCLWCPYGSVCGFDPRSGGGRRKPAMTDGELWQLLREEAAHG